MMLAARLFDLPVGTAEMDVRAVECALFPEEESVVSGAVPKRRLEFTAGRACARRAMDAIGESPAAILQMADRSPLWPSGLVGSITHAGDRCAAAVARTADGILALGIDLEPFEPLRDDLLKYICVPEELDELRALPEGERGLLAKAIFSAKECAYKCQYALSRALLGFHAMRVRLDLIEGNFTALFRRDAPPFVSGQELRGRLLIDRGYLMTAMTLTRADRGVAFVG